MGYGFGEYVDWILRSLIFVDFGWCVSFCEVWDGGVFVWMGFLYGMKICGWFWWIVEYICYCFSDWMMNVVFEWMDVGCV